MATEEKQTGFAVANQLGEVRTRRGQGGRIRNAQQCVTRRGIVEERRAQYDTVPKHLSFSADSFGKRVTMRDRVGWEKLGQPWPSSETLA